MRDLHARIKVLESVVEKQHIIIEDKDCLLDAADSMTDELQQRIHKERTDRVDSNSLAKEAKQLKSSVKEMRKCAMQL